MAECRHPIPIEKYALYAPCGKCPECLARKRSDWSFRLKEQLRVAKTAFFVTLTYSPEMLPKDKKVNKKHVQDYIKKVRRDNKLRIKYFAISEYGDKFGRPHYHMIIFNVDNEFKLADKWDYGYVHIGKVTDASIHYCTKYMLKSQDKNENIPPSQRKGGELFSLISKGLGESYVDRAKEWHVSGLKSYVVNNGYKQALPQYLRNKLFNEEQKEMLLNEFKSIQNDKCIKHSELTHRLAMVESLSSIEGEIQKKNRMKKIIKRGKL